MNLYHHSLAARQKTAALPSRESGMEANIQLSREIFSEGRLYMNILSIVANVATIIMAGFAIYDFYNI